MFLIILFFKTDLSHSDTRLSLLLNGLDLHIFNRSHLYNELEKLFGLESLIIPPDESPKSNLLEKQVSQSKNEEHDSWGSRILGRSWRDLIPVIKVDICSVSSFVCSLCSLLI